MRTKLKHKMAQWAWNNYKKIKAREHKLTYFFWEATLRCNLSCRHCGSDCHQDNQAIDLPTEQVLSVFKNIAAHYNANNIMLAVTGGEPLMRPDLLPLLSKISQLGFPWGMVTNGLLLTENKAKEALASGMTSISFSLDGLSTSHNWLRNQQGAFEKTINNIKMLRKLAPNLHIDVITCVNPTNINELDDLHNFLCELKIQSWRMFSIFAKGRALQNSDIIITAPLLKKLFSFISEKRKSSLLKISYSEEGFLGYPHEGSVRDIFYHCTAGIHVGSLLADGSFSACPSLAPEWKQGHLSEISFSKAWKTRYKNMRNRKWRKNKSCGNCSQWKHCEGNSLHLWDWEQQQPQLCHYKMLKD